MSKIFQDKDTIDNPDEFYKAVIEVATCKDLADPYIEKVCTMIDVYSFGVKQKETKEGQ